MKYLALVALLLLGSTNAWALVPVSYRTLSGENWDQIAKAHSVTTEALRAANPGVTDVAAGFLKLPDRAVTPRKPLVALMASGYKEVAGIVETARITGVYRIVGRELHVGTWNGIDIIAGVAGGNLTNAAIGTTLLFQNFDVSVMGFVGIAGGGGTTRIGDALVASGAVQHDHGNWWDFEVAPGQVFAGMTWSMRGPPIITDTGRFARPVLVPPADMLARIQRSVSKVQLPPIGADIASFHGVERYSPSVLVDGWSVSGAQFITSHHARATMERRIALVADLAGVPRPRHFIVDQEDFGAVQAAEEHGVPWFIVRVVVDLAAQKNAGVGIPMSLYDTPDEIPAWLAKNGQESHKKDFDYSYFYRQVALVTAPIVKELGTAAK